MQINFRKAEIGDAEILIANIRPEDLNELLCSGDDVLSLIQYSITTSDEAFAAESNGELLAIVGCGQVDGCGIPWMLGTKKLDCKGMGKAIHSNGLKFVSDWLSKYGKLYNAVHSKNKKAIRWLEGLGFVVHRDCPVDVSGNKFYTFSMGY